MVNDFADLFTVERTKKKNVELSIWLKSEALDLFHVVFAVIRFVWKSSTSVDIDKKLASFYHFVAENYLTLGTHP